MGLPLPRLVQDVLHPWHQVLHTAGQLRVADIPHRVHKFYVSYAQSQTTARGRLSDLPAVGTGEAVLAQVLCGGWRGRRRCVGMGTRCRSSASGHGGRDGAAEWG